MHSREFAAESAFDLGGVGAGDGIRTRDINLGKVALYQLSYSRAPTLHCLAPGGDCQMVPARLKIPQKVAKRTVIEMFYDDCSQEIILVSF